MIEKGNNEELKDFNVFEPFDFINVMKEFEESKDFDCYSDVLAHDPSCIEALSALGDNYCFTRAF